MGTEERKSGSYLNGVPELLILRLLSSRAMYGYEIVAAIRSSTNDLLNFGEGLIYPLLHAMEDEGWLTTKRETVNGRPRVYYRLTAGGKKRLQQSTEDWQRVSAAIQLVLGGNRAQPSVS